MDELLELQKWAKEQFEKAVAVWVENSGEKSGIESNAKIVVWDKLLKKLDEMIIGY